MLSVVASAGSMILRLPRASLLRCRVTVRPVDHEPESASSSVMRWADHLCSRRQDSIFSMTQTGVACELQRGLDERSSSPASP